MRDMNDLRLQVLKGNQDAARELLGRGADPNERDSLGRTPLYLAIAHDRRGAFEELLAAGAEVDVRDFMGDSPLHFAARHGRQEMAQRLLELGAAVNAQDAFGNTPLHRLAYEHPQAAPAFFELLVERGARLELRNRAGVSTEDLFATLGNRGLLDRLRKLSEAA